jgi:hypothetical protein
MGNVLCSGGLQTETIKFKEFVTAKEEQVNER